MDESTSGGCHPRRACRGALLALTVLSTVIAIPARSNGCEEPDFDTPRSDNRYTDTIAACSDAERASDDRDASALLGYLFRNGYGVPRDVERAASHFSTALDGGSCHAEAVCGLRAIEGGGAAPECRVDCEALGAKGTASSSVAQENDSLQRAYQLLAEMRRTGDGQTRLSVDGITEIIDEIMTQEQSLRDEAYLELCTGHLKRATVTVSLSYQLERESKRRARLIEHHEGKVTENNDARSQATLQRLAEMQRRAVADRQVYFEKYTSAVFAASDCANETLEDAYARFEREVAEVEVTELERRAFELFRGHVEDARAGRGISSGWFGNLGELLE